MYYRKAGYITIATIIERKTMSKELFNYLFDLNDNVPLEPKSISIQDKLPRIPAPICSHLCIRHRLLRLNYHIASPNQSQIALCKKHLHTHSQINEEKKY
jgi:hypothetical protein